MPIRSRLTIGGAALALALAAAPALATAQPAPPTDAQRQQWRAEHEQMEAAHKQAMVQDLAVVLQLRPDQQPALMAWLDTMHAHGPMGMNDGKMGDGKMGMRQDDAAEATLTTPQALDRMDAMMARREGEHRAGEQATRAFYAALGPQQQRVFDALMRLQHGMSDHPGMGDHHGMHGEWGMHGAEGMHDGPPPPR